MQDQKKENLREFSVRLKALMEKRGVRPRDIQHALGVKSGNVSGWRRGDYYPGTELRPKLARLLGVSESYLIHGISDDDCTENLRQYQPAAGRNLRVQETLDRPMIAPRDEESARPAQRQATAADCEAYFRSYLERARRDPNGVPYVWMKLQKLFPLDEFDEK